MNITSSNASGGAGSGNGVGEIKLPSALFASFKLYKRETDRLASWLGDTAYSLGYQLNATPDKASAAAASAAKASSTDADFIDGDDEEDEDLDDANDDTESGQGQDDQSDAAGNNTRSQKRRAGKDDKASSAAASHSASTAASGARGGANGEDQSTTVMTTRQFVDLAQFIADLDNPPVIVPPRVIDWACCAIHARRTCANWFSGTTAAVAASLGGQNSAAVDGTEKSNRTHEYFISILEQVVSILAPRVGYANSSANGGMKQLPKPMTGIELLESRFAALDMDGADVDGNDEGYEDVFALVEETVKGGSGGGQSNNNKGGKGKSNQKSPNKPGNNKSNTAGGQGQHRRYRVQYEDENDYLLSLLNFLHENDEVRTFIKDTWRQYMSGDLDLEVASMVTMAAVDKLQVAHDSLKETFPTLITDLPTYAMQLYHYLCTDRKQAPTAKNSTTWSLAQFSLLAVGHVLETLRAGIAGKEVPVPKVGLDLKAIIRWHNVLARMYHDWTQVKVTQCMRKVPNPVLNGLKNLFSADPATASPSIPLFICVVTQVYLDIFDITCPDSLSSPDIVDDVIDACAPHAYALDQYIQYNPVKSSHWHDPKAYELVQRLRERSTIAWLVDLSESDDEGDQGPEIGVQGNLVMRILSRHAWLAGLLTVYTHEEMGRAGLMIVDKYKCVLFAAYVFRAVELASAYTGIDAEGGSWWPLMASLMRLTGEDYVFYGRAPATLEDMWVTLNLQMGVSIADKHQADLEASRKQHRRNIKRPKVNANPMRMPQLLKNFGRAVHSLGIGSLVVDRAQGKRKADESTAVVEKMAVRHCNDIINPTSISMPTAVASQRRIKSFETVEYLTHLRTHLPSFMPYLTHNLLLLHVQARRVLHCVRECIVKVFMSSPVAHALMPEDLLGDFEAGNEKEVCISAVLMLVSVLDIVDRVAKGRPPRVAALVREKERFAGLQTLMEVILLVKTMEEEAEDEI
ncbi:hypothetical protein BCR44DRAFT_61069 [Catenaria anguillulae PL171]|uniref:DUF6604 domain-containing protein n=1 Tax=Catenaria anguillulae PL171 TaxID=765915 RepID=A0A1Y2HMK3_9FUNG|nr:hypothetical protein BCR44DRAFT_61069 [Catenaria anguillulae PL171]